MGEICGVLFATLPGDAIPPEAAIGYALWVGLTGLASGAVAFALGPLVGRAGSAAIAGAVLAGGYMLNGYQTAAPALAGPANLTWFGWTAHHTPLAGAYDWPSLIPVALVTVALLAVGVELFARRDLGATTRLPWPGFPTATLGLSGPISRSIGERLPLAIAWGIGVGLLGLVMGSAAGSFGSELARTSPDVMKIFEAIFPNINLTEPGAFLQLVFVEFGVLLSGFAAATLVSGWASDESSGRLEMLLTTPMARARWAVAGGFGVMGAIVVMTALFAVGIGFGVALAGGSDATPVLGTLVLGLYAAAVAGFGLAVGGVFRTSIAAEAAAGFVILTFFLDLIPPALKWPDWLHQLALTSHLGQPMIGTWDSAGIVACLAIALGGVLLAGWGIARRDIER